MFILNLEDAFSDGYAGGSGQDAVEGAAAIDALQKLRRARDAVPFTVLAEGDHEHAVAADAGLFTRIDLCELDRGVGRAVTVKVAAYDFLDLPTCLCELIRFVGDSRKFRHV